MSKLRVLHFPFHCCYGGPEIQLPKFWRYMDHTKLQMGIVMRIAPTEEYQRLYEPACEFFTIDAHFQDPSFMKQMSTALDGVDILHLHTYHWVGGFPLEELAVQKGVPRVIVHARNSGLEKTAAVPREVQFERHEHYKSLFSTELATDFAACSQSAADWLFGPQIPRERIKLLHNAVDVQEFRYSPEQRRKLREQWGLEDCFVLGHVGRLAEPKNPFYMLRVFREIHKQNPKARLVWIGEGDLEQRILAQLGDVSDAVLMLGARRDISDWMQVFDCLLLPSLFEGLPNVAVEAQAAGLPCFISDRVTREVGLTDLAHFWPLEWTPAQWAENILAYPFSEERPDTSEQLAEHGYELRAQAKNFERYYLEGL